MVRIASAPLRLKQLRLEARRQLAGLVGGTAVSRRPGHGLDFHELRPYQPGDDIRHLDWNVTARLDVPHVRRYREEHGRNILLLADLSTSMLPPVFEMLQEVAALLVFAALGQRDRVGLCAFADTLLWSQPPRGSETEGWRLLHRLQQSRTTGNATDLRPPLEAAGRLMPRPGMILLLTDGYCRLPESPLRRLAARHDCIALLLRPDNLTRLPAGLWGLRDAESGQPELAWSTGDNPGAADSDSTCDRLRQLGFDPLVLNGRREPLADLMAFFRRRRQG
ncbi:MAG: DUF58 domain-containing protein [Deltaproteobacteria bacterium]|nr:MAG: DUF58 domain-containing protein [Deltaproteobacteria bacterium]